jgi:hypothetical protein
MLKMLPALLIDLRVQAWLSVVRKVWKRPLVKGRGEGAIPDMGMERLTKAVPEAFCM